MPTPAVDRRRSTRFRPEVPGLETRQLLSAARPVASAAAGRPIMGQPTYTQVGFMWPDAVVSRHDAEAMLEVFQTPYDTPFRVRVVVEEAPEGVPTDPIEASFPAGASDRAVVVPLGTPRPGDGDAEVKLRLELVESSGEVRLIQPTATILLADREDVTPPRVESSRLTRRGVELTFSEPMDPARAGDPNSYTLLMMGRQKSFRPFSVLKNLTLSVSVPTVTPAGARSASYDEATRTVTIVPSRPIDPKGSVFVEARHGQDDPRTRGNRPQPAGPLTDLAGNVIEGPAGRGRISVGVFPGSRVMPVPEGLG